MKLRQLALAVTVAAAGLSSALVSTVATAQTKEQFFPVLVYRTGAYAPNGVPFANGYVDYLKLVNARGGINGVKVSFEECETGYATDRGVECYERLKGKNGGATVFQNGYVLASQAPGTVQLQVWFRAYNGADWDYATVGSPAGLAWAAAAGYTDTGMRAGWAWVA